VPLLDDALELLELLELLATLLVAEVVVLSLDDALVLAELAAEPPLPVLEVAAKVPVVVGPVRLELVPAPPLPKRLSVSGRLPQALRATASVESVAVVRMMTKRAIGEASLGRAATRLLAVPAASMENVPHRGADQSLGKRLAIALTSVARTRENVVVDLCVDFDVGGEGGVAQDAEVGEAGPRAQPRSTPISRSSESRSSASSPFLMKSYAPASVAAFFASSCAE